MAVDKQKLIRLQKEDYTLQRFKKTKVPKTKKGYANSYEKCGEIWYRMRQQKDKVGDTRKQILVPKSLREKVIEVAQEFLFGRLLGVRKWRKKSKLIFFDQDHTRPRLLVQKQRDTCFVSFD